MNSEADPTPSTTTLSAADEREAILAILERAMRRLVHGHGANGIQVLQGAIDEIRRREQA